MTQVMAGRYTARVEGSFVVFLIGMRVNQFWAVGKWVPTLRAMGPMLRTLYRDPEKGFLGGETFLYWRGVALVSYWRSFEDLEKFARSPDEPHLEAWRRFQRSVGADGSVGIWHESYLVESGHYEAMYGNMPRFGLAAATEHIPIAGRRETARGRIGADKTQE
ncbi:MAG: DUF4188 domain-containing protein [Aphanocapsa lilacina HA4352-LM1]|jgi:hypothetical protein|nr:DUF4188 domain-containing protein [Aphanocapsa lilacina HA4352-LM1]